jgi:uncharacterized protein
VHGCDYASMVGVRRWVSGLAGRALRGTVKVVPIVNLPAFRARSLFVVPEDGKNLNRCFPGSPDGTLAERLAFAVFDQVITGSDALVDMHAGDSSPLSRRTACCSDSARPEPASCSRATLPQT